MADADAEIAGYAYGSETDPDNPEGIINLTVDKSRTLSLAPGEYWYQFKYIDVDGNASYWLPEKDANQDERFVEVYKTVTTRTEPIV